MQEVLRLVNAGDHRSALVRLWVLATSRTPTDDDLTLNVWEKATKPAVRHQQVTTLLDQLDREQPLEAAKTDPLALVAALDQHLAYDLAPRPFIDLPYDIEGRQYFLVPLNLGRANAIGAARQANNPQSWFRHHRVVPSRLPSGLRVEPRASRDVTDLALRGLRSKKSVRAFIGHFNDAARLDPPPVGKFFVRGLANERDRSNGIRALLDRVNAERSDIVVLPELSVTPLQRELASALFGPERHRPALCVMGSFHEEPGGRRVNRSELLGADGRRLLDHEKLRPFGDADGIAEDIQAANRIHLLVTPIGSIAIVICKDYCDDPGPIRDWDTLAVDWWLVPSMGDSKTLRAHEQRAVEQWKVINRAVTFVANQEVSGDSERRPGFAFDGEKRSVEIGGSVVEIELDSSPMGKFLLKL